MHSRGIITKSSVHYLYLYCADINYIPESISRFVDQCRDYGLLSDDDTLQGDGHYLLGDKFPMHVCFLGCSPYLKLLPEFDNDKDYCCAYVNYSETPEFTFSNTLKPPVCPTCGGSLDIDMATLADNKQRQLACNHCHANVDFKDLNWRKDAGYYNFSIRISNIFPKEAVPGDGLMQWLQQQTGAEWKYFYV